MASDEGSQIVTIRFHRPVDSDIVNKRFKDIQTLGIHKGGYLTKTGGNAVSLSPLVCEVSDGTHQVRVEVTVAVTKTLSEAAPYLVLNWTYSGVENTDFMVIETSGNPDANDIVVGKGIFVASALSTIDYSERTTPDTHHLFLRVEEMETPSSSVRVRAGVGHAGSAHSPIIDQVISLSAYSSGNTIYVYVNDAGGVVHSKTASNYVGKALLAKIIYPADGIIENSDIEDVRSFVVPPAIPDGSSITRNSNGKLEVKELGITNDKIHSNVPDGVTIKKDGTSGKLEVKELGITNDKIHSNVPDGVTIEKDGSTGKLQVKDLGINSIFGPRTDKDSLNNTLVRNVVYKVTSDGFVSGWQVSSGETLSRIYSDANSYPVEEVYQLEPESGDRGTFLLLVRKNEYWRTSGSRVLNLKWMPIGTGACIKQ